MDNIGRKRLGRRRETLVDALLMDEPAGDSHKAIIARTGELM
jgi:hypothetical protein